MITLKYGDRESSTKKVRGLQTYLTRKGFSTNGIDGVFGNDTLSAVKKFQKAVGYPQTGTVDTGLMIRIQTYNPPKNLPVISTTGTQVKSFSIPKLNITNIFNNKTLIYIAGSLVIIAMLYPMIKGKRKTA